MLNRITKLALLSLLGIIVIAADHSYAASNRSLTTVAVVGDDDDDDDRKRGRRGRRDRSQDRSQERSDREARRQQRDSDRESRRQQRHSDNESRRQQQWSDWNSRRQQGDSDRESRRQQQWSDRNSRQQRRDRDDDDNNRRWRRDRDRNDDRRVIYVSPQGYWNQVWNAQRKDQRRYEKEQRKYLKEQQKAGRRYARDQRRYYNQNVDVQRPVYYGSDNDFYKSSGGGSDWKDLILRNVIANMLGGGGFGGGDLLNPNRYVRNAPNYAYYDDGYSYQQPSRPYYAPSQIGYGYDELYDSPTNGLLNSLPIAEIIQQFTGDNEFISTLVGGFLSQGYDQGYLAGQTARQYNYDDEYYNDPYAYSNGSSDLHSAALAENRQYLSQGYELGYQDALNGNTGYDPYAQGNVDLVSALLNNVLSGI